MNKEYKISGPLPFWIDPTDLENASKKLNAIETYNQIATFTDELEESEEAAKLFKEIAAHQLSVGIREDSPNQCFVIATGQPSSGSLPGFRSSNAFRVHYGLSSGQTRSQALAQGLRILDRFQSIIDSIDHSSSDS